MSDISLEEEYVVFMLVSRTTDSARSIFGVDHARLVKNEWTELATSASISLPYTLVETLSHTTSSYRSSRTSCVGSLPTTTGLDSLKSSRVYSITNPPNLFYTRGIP
ncbi:hypothetical protein B0H13DRAFT_1883829 [Mycena leptocephala]|nr:hypothetical protein B0H13DRAFT_1883829 [Mycena leptocephala]